MRVTIRKTKPQKTTRTYEEVQNDTGPDVAARYEIVLKETEELLERIGDLLNG